MKAGTEKEQRYGSTLSLTSALDVSGWLTQLPGRFTPGIDLVIPCIGGQVGPRYGLKTPRSHRDSISRPSSPRRIATAETWTNYIKLPQTDSVVRGDL